ncbi:unnamed protein product [Zymoseptoria tritici ST99CH_1A5]|uniref:PCI domain-containing protein n=2 Tax=Zymoseptoria tritici TaxID=1047171 RepID=A0A2H1GPS6_ZYMTR|nr:unnamed protein product [Zymoseptoria tritici ST99CH_1E4]SMR57884.1 unnamed protein product [Zymoseptoria tritici ST99CH_3D1]SMY26319.1 unnamed protein product [Zymoseptoria tritici ST99CH_1A5]
MARRGSNALPPPTFDLDTWASNYDGAILPLRLAHVAIHCPSLAHAALTLAITNAKRGRDVQIYRRLVQLAAQMNIPDLQQEDTEWSTKQDEDNRRKLTRMEGELRGYKNNLIRESIRMGQEDLANYHLETGGPVPDPTNASSLATSGYNAAYQAYGKMRDYCTTPIHVAAMNLRLAYTAFLQAVHAQATGNSGATHFNAALINANRLRSAGVKEEEEAKLLPIVHVAAGIASLSTGDYRSAALSFMSAPFEYHNLGSVHGTNFERAIATANDVAIYGGLCALATLTRQELLDNVLGGPFRAFLEQEPHMRKAIGLYTTAKYQACINTLQHYYSDWSLDIFLGANASTSSASTHVDRLFERIRERSLTAYFSSFSEVSLASLASTFPPLSSAPNAMEYELLGMIKSGALDARLDAVNGVLVAPRKEPRQAAHAEAKKTAEDIERTLLLRLHKVNVVLAGLDIPKQKGGEQWLSRGNSYQ